MLRFAVLAIWFAAVCAAPTTEEIDSPDVMVVDSIDEYLVQHPNVEILKQLKEDEMEDRLHVGYTIGERVSGDRRLETKTFKNEWSSPQNVKFKVAYPPSGVQAFITCVKVTSHQTNNLGGVHVISGGTGQWNITLVVEAQKTLYLRIQAELYGFFKYPEMK